MTSTNNLFGKTANRNRIIIIGTLVLFALFLIGTAHAEPANTYIYSSSNSMITVINPVTLQKVTDIETNYNPGYIIVNPAGTQLWVAEDNHGIAVYNTVDYTLLKYIDLTGYSAQVITMAANQYGDSVYVTMANDRVIKIDATTFNISNSINFFTAYGSHMSPWGITYYNGYFYVSDYTNNSIVKLDSNLNVITWIGKGFKSVAGGPFYSPYYIITDLFNNRIVAVNYNGTATIINPVNDQINGFLNCTTRQGGGGVSGISVNNTGYYYMPDYNTNVTIFYPNKTIFKNVTGLSNPDDVVCNNYNTTVFVGSQDKKQVYVIDNYTLLGYIPVGNSPYRITIGTQATAYQHSVKFIMQSTFGIFKYSNMTVAVYDNIGNLVFTGLTDNTGQVAFYLQPTINYRLWIYSASDNVNINKSYTPYDDTYYVDVKGLFTDWNPFGWIQNIIPGWTGAGSGNVEKDVTTNYTVNTTANPRLFTINYGDKSSSTSSINFTLLRYWQTNNTYTVFNTTIIAGSGIGYQNLTISVPPGLADGQSWTVAITSQTGAYGVVKRNDNYRFPGTAFPIPGLPAGMYIYVCFGITVILALMFTYVSTGVGLFVIAGLNLIFIGLGWLAWSDSYVLLLQVLAVFGAGAIFKMRKRQEGV